MASYPTLHEIRSAADDYWEVWQGLLTAAPKLRHVIGQHEPSAFGWKVEGDLAPLEAAGPLYELGDSLFMGPVNRERAIMTIRKPEPFALDALRQIKLLQRRPSRPEDKLGPDSLDFLVPHGLPKADELREALAGTEASFEEQSNEVHDWVAIYYQEREFKLTAKPVWAICVAEAAALVDLTVK
jgi:hypothetical protein